MDENEIVSDSEVADSTEAVEENAEVLPEPESKIEADPKVKMPLPPVRKDKFFISALVLISVGIPFFIGLMILPLPSKYNNLHTLWGILSTLGAYPVVFGAGLLVLFAIERKTERLKYSIMPVLSTTCEVACVVSLTFSAICGVNVVQLILVFVAIAVSFSLGIAAIVKHRDMLNTAEMALSVLAITIPGTALAIAIFGAPLLSVLALM